LSELIRGLGLALLGVAAGISVVLRQAQHPLRASLGSAAWAALTKPCVLAATPVGAVRSAVVYSAALAKMRRLWLA